LTGLEILPDLFFIERGLLHGNHFAYRGRRPILIDTGHVCDCRETLDLIAAVGVDPGRVGLIINTHAHYDHVGADRIIQERSGCAIALHRIGKHFVDTKDHWATWWRYYKGLEDFSFRCNRALEDGEMVAVGPHEFRVVYCPGHAADLIALYHPREKILISSDALFEDDMPALNLPVEGSRTLFTHLETLDRLAALDIRMVFPGHGPPFTNAGAAITKARQKLETYLTDRTKAGQDLLKKLFVYTLLTHGPVEEAGFFPRLMSGGWFKETVDLDFGGRYREKYREVLQGLLDRGLICRNGHRLYTPIKP